MKEIIELPRLPLEGYLDLTYRCNNDCRHCWVRIPAKSQDMNSELSFDEIKELVTGARSMGCRKWFISGGEPMLRPDFADIFDYITKNSVSYYLNTNGTLITPEIASLMKRKGVKLVALYGATAEVHDHITRNPGSFQATMQGISYLKEAGASFTVQIVPMKDNFHQLQDMKKLASSLSPSWRVGITWLYLSAQGDTVKNAEIIAQRLSPRRMIELNHTVLSFDEPENQIGNCHMVTPQIPDRLFTSCIDARRDFHIDPYGNMSFCSYIKEPSLRYDLRKGTFKDCWETFLPSLTTEILGGDEFLKNCGACKLKPHCFWCPVYGYLEHRRFSAKVEYLCEMANEMKRSKVFMIKNQRRFYQIGGISVQVDSDLPISDTTFHPKFKYFEVSEPGDDIIFIKHHFMLPVLNGLDLGEEEYRKPPWAIYRKGNSWIYLGIADEKDTNPYSVAVFNADYTRARIYHKGDSLYRKGGLTTLTFFPSDQILLAQVLADKQGCFLHSSGVIFEKKGILFLGHSGAGKSTMVKMLQSKAEILCDDRVIVRKWPEGFRIHGTWSHGEIPEVSPGSAPLKAILILNQGLDNRLLPVNDRKESVKKILACMIKPYITADWWDKMLLLAEEIVREIPCYSLSFDRSGRVVKLLKDFHFDKNSQIG